MRDGGTRLTQRDLEVLATYEQLRAATGYAPSVRELGRTLGFTSTQGVQRHSDRLVSAGRLQRGGAKRPRALVGQGGAVRLVPLLEDPWGTALTGGSVALPEAGIAAPEERVVAVRVGRGRRGGPARGDLVFVSLDRNPTTGTLVVSRDAAGALVVHPRGQARSGGPVAVVLAWMHLVDVTRWVEGSTSR